MEKLDTLIVHRMMSLYFVCASPKISTRAFTAFLLASLSAKFLGVGDSCQQDSCAELQRGSLSSVWYLSCSDPAKFEGDIS